MKALKIIAPLVTALTLATNTSKAQTVELKPTTVKYQPINHSTYNRINQYRVPIEVKLPTELTVINRKFQRLWDKLDGNNIPWRNNGTREDSIQQNFFDFVIGNGREVAFIQGTNKFARSGFETVVFQGTSGEDTNIEMAAFRSKDRHIDIEIFNLLSGGNLAYKFNDVYVDFGSPHELNISGDKRIMFSGGIKGNNHVRSANMSFDSNGSLIAGEISYYQQSKGQSELIEITVTLDIHKNEYGHPQILITTNHPLYGINKRLLSPGDSGYALARFTFKNVYGNTSQKAPNIFGN